MPTYDQLVTRVRRELRGFTLDQASVCTLDQDMLASDTTFTADTADISEVSRGLVEIDDELILVKSFDSQTGVVTVLGGLNGRGAEDTTAASHTAEAIITMAPTFPRKVIKDAINDSITNLYPSLVVLDTTDFAYTAAQVEYAMPAEAEDVWSVVGRWVGPELVSGAMPNWRFSTHPNATDFPTGRSIQLWTGITPGQNVRVVYSKRPALLVNNADDFATTTGYPDRVADLVVWDAARRLLPSVMSARLQQTSVESTERSQLVGTGDVQRAVQTYSAMYGERLQTERERQFQENPNFQTFQGS
jgi:hypothetical protein